MCHMLEQQTTAGHDIPKLHVSAKRERERERPQSLHSYSRMTPSAYTTNRALAIRNNEDHYNNIPNTGNLTVEPPS